MKAADQDVCVTWVVYSEWINWPALLAHLPIRDQVTPKNKMVILRIHMGYFFYRSLDIKRRNAT